MLWWDCTQLENDFFKDWLNETFLEYDWWGTCIFRPHILKKYNSTKIIENCWELSKNNSLLLLDENLWNLRYIWNENCEIMIKEKEINEMYDMYKNNFSLNQVIIIEIISIFITIIISSILSIFIYKKLKKSRKIF